MEFAFPNAFFLLLGFVIWPVFWAFAYARQRHIRQRLGEDALLLSSAQKGYSQWMIARKALFLLGWVFLTVAIARPRAPLQAPAAEQEQVALNIVIALDCSTSMLAQDYSPSRLERAKIEIARIADTLKGDRLGLVVFAADAFVHCPLTTDYVVLKRLLSDVSVDSVPEQGTDIARVLEVSIKALENRQGYGAIILISDGETEGKDKAYELAQKAKEEGIEIFCVGIGSEKPTPIRLKDGTLKKDKDGNVVLTKLDEEPLNRIAAIANGAYVRSGASLGVDKIFQMVKDKERERISSNSQANVFVEYYHVPLLIAIALFCAYWFLAERPFAKGNILFLCCIALIFSGCRAQEYARLNRVLKDNKAPIVKKAEAIEALLKKHPDDALLNYNYGVYQYKTDKFDDAIRLFDIARTTQRDDLRQQAEFNLGNAYFKKGDIRSAADRYIGVLLNDPNNRKARFNLEVALRLLAKEQEVNKSKNEEQQKGNESQEQSKGASGQQGQQGQENQDEKTVGKPDKAEEERGKTDQDNSKNTSSKEEESKATNEDKNGNQQQAETTNQSEQGQSDSSKGQGQDNENPAAALENAQAVQSDNGKDLDARLKSITGIIDKLELLPKDIYLKKRRLKNTKSERDW